jgi:cysteine desulfurase / selenocysteine lyase
VNDMVRQTVEPYDAAKIREDFPILAERPYGKPLVYLDNAASAQKPKAVIDRLTYAYEHEYANVHRGLHYLANAATEAYEAARETVRRFLNAASTDEIIFTRSATEAINLAAASFGLKNIGAGDEIVLSVMEHHSNIVPWQLLCEEKGATLRVAPINDAGELLLGEFEKLLSPAVKIAAIPHVSNALGTINPVKEMVRKAHALNIPVLIDGAQAAPHLPIDVQDLGCDFYAYSSHKVYGPTGVGVLYGKAALLEAMPPYQGGGDMISSVTFEKTLYNKIPHKFEAGTPDIAGVIGLGAAIAWVGNLGIRSIGAHEHALLAYATKVIGAIPGVRLVGTAREKAGVLSFLIQDIHPHDIGTILDQEGIAVRTGHHCAQPVMERFRIPATVRASFAAYNTLEEIDLLARGIEKVWEVLG